MQIYSIIICTTIFPYTSTLYPPYSHSNNNIRYRISCLSILLRSARSTKILVLTAHKILSVSIQKSGFFLAKLLRVIIVDIKNHNNPTMSEQIDVVMGALGKDTIRESLGSDGGEQVVVHMDIELAKVRETKD
jgi:hypothetical protein